MDIKKALGELVTRLTYSSNILPLLEDEIVSVIFCFPNSDPIILFVSRKEISIELECENPALLIKGAPSVLLQLIEGKTRLQSLQKRGEISVQGKYRHILKIESLFYCCPFEMVTV